MSPVNSAVVSARDVSITIDVGDLRLVPGAQAREKDDLHIHYLLDVDPAPWLGGTRDIPTGDPNIIHSAATSHTFKDLKPGPHKVTIVLTDANHLATQPAVSAAVSFTVGDPSPSKLPTAGGIPAAAPQIVGLIGSAMVAAGWVSRRRPH